MVRCEIRELDIRTRYCWGDDHRQLLKDRHAEVRRQTGRLRRRALDDGSTTAWSVRSASCTLLIVLSVLSWYVYVLYFQQKATAVVKMQIDTELVNVR